MDQGAVMYAVLHPPNFLAQVAARMLPALRGRPFALLEGEPPSELVCAANQAARSLGIAMGMTLLQAESLAGVMLVRRNPEHERAAQVALHALACNFSPRIEAVPMCPGTYALDIQGMETLYVDATHLANKLKEGALAEGFVVHVAVAQNFHTAACIAVGRRGISIVPEGCEAEAMANLPLRVLHLEPHHAATFQSWGLRTCGELAALPEADLIARIGQAGRRLHLLARGQWPHLMFPIAPTFEASLIERMELDHPVEMLEPLLFLLSRMTDAILEKVRTRALAIGSLQVILRLDGGMPYRRVIRPALPLDDRPTLLKLLQIDLDTHPPGASVLGLELQAQSAAPYRAQHGLFLPQAPEPGRLEVLLARLTKLLGEDRAGSPELMDDHRPNAFRMVLFAPPPPAKAQGEPRSVTALRVSRPPQAIGVALTGSTPAQIFYEGQRYKVRDAAGPWRVSGQWWSEERWCREEWDVRLATESEERVCRIALDPRSKCWYLQGTYD